MQGNRDMFYSDYQASGYMPMGMPNVNAYSYQGFNSGNTPNVNMMPSNVNQNSFDNSNYMENRILKLERQVKRLESRITRIENLSGNSLTDDLSSTNDLYMI